MICKFDLKNSSSACGNTGVKKYGFYKCTYNYTTENDCDLYGPNVARFQSSTSNEYAISRTQFTDIAHYFCRIEMGVVFSAFSNIFELIIRGK